MYPKRFKIFIFIGIFLLGFSASVWAVRDLISHSPFLPPGYQAAKKQTNQKLTRKPLGKPTANLVFKGFFRLGGVWKFSVLDKKTGKSQWLTLNDKTEDGLTLLGFDQDGSRLQYSSNGIEGELELMSPSSTPVPINSGASRSSPRKPTIPSRPGPSRNTSPPKPAIPSRKPSASFTATSPATRGGSPPSGSVAAAAKAPSNPPPSPPPSFIPKLPAHLANSLPSGVANAMKDAEDRGQSSINLDLGTAGVPKDGQPVVGTTAPSVTPATSPATAANPSSAYTAPPLNPAAAPPGVPQQPTTIIPRRKPLNLPPGVPPPPTTAPPSLPSFLNIGGPPSGPPKGKP